MDRIAPTHDPLRDQLKESLMYRRLPQLLAIVITLASPIALADPAPQPVLRQGSCPSGYYGSGDYCVPNTNARYAVPRIGSCPSGYYGSGDYCVATSSSSKLAIPRRGSCPSGYYGSGDYCVSTN